MKTLITINDIKVISNDEYIWEVLKENDGSKVFRINLGDIGQDILTVLYAKNTLSVREYNSTYEGGFSLYMEMPFGNTSFIIKSIINAHNLTLMPLYHIDTVKLKNKT